MYYVYVCATETLNLLTKRGDGVLTRVLSLTAEYAGNSPVQKGFVRERLRRRDAYGVLRTPNDSVPGPSRDVREAT